MTANLSAVMLTRNNWAAHAFVFERDVKIVSEARILHLDTPKINMGNAFVDLGSIQALKKARPQSVINAISGSQRVYFENKSYGHQKKIEKSIPSNLIKIFGEDRYKSLIGKISNRVVNADSSFVNFFDLPCHFDSDYVAISGCTLNDYTIKRYGSTLLRLAKKGLKIIFNGAGGEDYSESEILCVQRFLRKIGLYALISRDHKAFESYEHLAQYCYDGIDCAFFMNDYFISRGLRRTNIENYVVLCFDRTPEPKINTSKKIIRTHHSPLGRPWEFPTLPRRYYDKPSTLVSDSADDYLYIYAGADIVHTDRIHACVPALAFGNPCRLYYNTQRALLLNRIGVSDFERAIYPDTQRIEKEKKRQVSFLSDVL